VDNATEPRDTQMLTKDYAGDLRALVLANLLGWEPGTRLGPAFLVIDSQDSTIVIRGPFGSLWGFDLWEYDSYCDRLPNNFEVFQLRVVPSYRYQRAES
jgi:hypothetical protein